MTREISQYNMIWELHFWFLLVGGFTGFLRLFWNIEFFMMLQVMMLFCGLYFSIPLFLTDKKKMLIGEE